MMLLRNIRVEEMSYAEPDMRHSLRDGRTAATGADDADGCAGEHLVALLPEK